MRDAATAIPAGRPSSRAASGVRPLPTASPGDKTSFPGQTQTNQTPVNLPNSKTNVCAIPLPPVKPCIYKTKKCIKELCVMKYLSLSACRLNTTVPDQAVPWQFRSSKAFNILSSHRERFYHKQLNSAWLLSRRYEMQKSHVPVEDAACRHCLGMEGGRFSSVRAHKWTLHLLHKECTRNWPLFFSISILSSSSFRNKVAIATETLKKKLA